MKKEKQEHFESNYDRAIYDLTELKSALKQKLEHFKKMGEKHQEISIKYKDITGFEWEAKTFEDLQDCYGWGGISSKKFERLTEQLENKQKYLQHSIQIPQIEDEIKMLEGFIDFIAKSKINHWPLY